MYVEQMQNDCKLKKSQLVFNTFTSRVKSRFMKGIYNEKLTYLAVFFMKNVLFRFPLFDSMMGSYISLITSKLTP